MEKKYIMIGASSINRDAFRRVLRPLDNYSFKPTGGFWACEKGDDLINISPWLDYLIEEREIALMKNIKASPISFINSSAIDFNKLVSLLSNFIIRVFTPLILFICSL